MSDPEVHIVAWEAAGLIDAPLAARLRAASAAPVAEVPAVTRSTSAGSFFGPVVTIGEVFAYLGLSFLLGAWLAFLSSVTQPRIGHREEVIMTGGLGMGLAALGLVGLGLFLKRGDSRRRRGAGVAFAAATVLVAGSGEYLVQMQFLIDRLQGVVPAVLVAAIATAAALVLRRLLPAVTTQLALLGWLTGLAGVVLLWIESLASYPISFLSHGCCVTYPPSPSPIGQVIGGAVWWLLVALGLGVLAIVEMRNGGGLPETGRRIGLTRFWAGLVAVVGLAITLTQNGPTGNDANGYMTYGPFIEPWIAQVAILAVSVVLVERAFRRNSTAFILAAAAGLIIVLTDFNVAYLQASVAQALGLAQSTYIGLLIEGGILLTVGFGGDRLRRRLSRPGRVQPPGTPPTASPAAADERHEPATIEDL
jgi:hypothetical protein